MQHMCTKEKMDAYMKAYGMEEYLLLDSLPGHSGPAEPCHIGYIKESVLYLAPIISFEDFMIKINPEKFVLESFTASYVWDYYMHESISEKTTIYRTYIDCKSNSHDVAELLQYTNARVNKFKSSIKTLETLLLKNSTSTKQNAASIKTLETLLLKNSACLLEETEQNATSIASLSKSMDHNMESLLLNYTTNYELKLDNHKRFMARFMLNMTLLIIFYIAFKDEPLFV